MRANLFSQILADKKPLAGRESIPNCDRVSNFSSQNSAFKSRKKFKAQIEDGFYDYIPKGLLLPSDQQRPFNLLHMATCGLKNMISKIKQKSNISNQVEILPGSYDDDYQMNYFT